MISNEQELFLKTVQNFQHCQRNFDLSQTIDDETVNWLLDVGYSTPTKQNLDSFEIVCVKDREKIKKFSIAATNGPDERHCLSANILAELEKGRIQNPQTDANLLFLFFIKPETRTSADRLLREQGDPVTDQYWMRCTNLEIGLAASAIGIAANTIGMRTGFCRCFDYDALPVEFLEPYNINPKHLQVMFGMGYPLHDDHTLHTDGEFISSSFPKNIPRKLVL